MDHIIHCSPINLELFSGLISIIRINFHHHFGFVLTEVDVGKTFYLLPRCGAFGTVTLEQAPNRKHYALKAISKGLIGSLKLERQVFRERDVLRMCDSDFVVRLFDTYSDDKYLYLLLEAVLGGELFALYTRNPTWRFDKRRTRFYSGSAALALQHMHSNNILYRDLKMENLLVDEKGRCKITDLGLAKVLTDGKAYTLCGTPEYLAPEILRGEGASFSADWWAFGVLLYELFTGHTPFLAHCAEELYANILRGTTAQDDGAKECHLYADIMPVDRVTGEPADRFSEVPSDARDLVLQLLHKVAEEDQVWFRGEKLGCRTTSFEKIKKDVFYRGVHKPFREFPFPDRVGKPKVVTAINPSSPDALRLKKEEWEGDRQDGENGKVADLRKEDAKKWEDDPSLWEFDWAAHEKGGAPLPLCPSSAHRVSFHGCPVNRARTESYLPLAAPISSSFVVVSLSPRSSFVFILPSVFCSLLLLQQLSSPLLGGSPGSFFLCVFPGGGHV